MNAENIYLSLLGELNQPLPDIPNAFAPGQPCEMLYRQVYSAKYRLNERLGTDEDPDVECIPDCFWDITRELCTQMYHLGAAQAPTSL